MLLKSVAHGSILQNDFVMINNLAGIVMLRRPRCIDARKKLWTSEHSYIAMIEPQAECTERY
jgi:hypothetical protein